MRRERAAELLHTSALYQATEVDREKTCTVEQRGNRGFGRGVVARQEDDSSPARLMRICPQHVGSQRVGSLYEPGAWHQVGDDLTGGAPAEIGIPRIRCVYDGLTIRRLGQDATCIETDLTQGGVVASEQI